MWYFWAYSCQEVKSLNCSCGSDKCQKPIETLSNLHARSRQLAAPAASSWGWLGAFSRSDHCFVLRHIFVPGKIFADVNLLRKAAISCGNKTVCLWVSLVFIKIIQPIKQVTLIAELPVDFFFFLIQFNFKSGHHMSFWGSFQHRLSSSNYWPYSPQHMWNAKVEALKASDPNLVAL